MTTAERRIIELLEGILAELVLIRKETVKPKATVHSVKAPGK